MCCVSSSNRSFCPCRPLASFEMPRPFSSIKKVPVIRCCLPHVLLSYLLCSLVFTYPLVFRLTTHVPGGKGDVPIYIWNLWWMKKALSEGISPLFCDYIFVPYGAALVLHTFVFLKAVLAMPLQWLCSAWTTYNILILATFAAAGWGMFLLARYLTGDGRAAWIAGLIYAFSPYMLTRSLRGPNKPSGVGPSASAQGRGQGTRPRGTPATVGAAARRQQGVLLGPLRAGAFPQHP